jgi:lipid A disaccharide synthetase
MALLNFQKPDKVIKIDSTDLMVSLNSDLRNQDMV